MGSITNKKFFGPITDFFGTLTQFGISPMLRRGLGSISDADILAMSPVFWADASDAAETLGNVTSWNDKISSTPLGITGTLTKTDSFADSLPAVSTNGINNGFYFARQEIVSFVLIGKVFDSEGRVFHVSLTDATDTLYATWLNYLAEYTIGQSGSGQRYAYPNTANEAAGTPDFTAYLFRNLADFSRGFVKADYTLRTATAGTSTATYMSFGYKSRGNNSNISEWLKMDVCHFIIFDREITASELYTIGSWIDLKYPSLGLSYHTAEPLASTLVENPLNPLVWGHSSGAGGDIGTPVSFYPPAVVLKDNVYYVGSKSGDSLGCMIKSTDGGVTWPEISGIKINVGGAGTWDELGYRDGRMFYNPDDSTYYWFYVGRKADLTESIGLATASDPEGTWTKYVSNPLLTVATVNTFFGSACNLIGIRDIMKVGSTYYWLMARIDTSGTMFCNTFMCTSASLTGALTIVGDILINRKDLFREYPFDNNLDGNSIIKIGNTWVMILTGGAADLDVVGENDIYIATSSAITGPYEVSRNILIEHGGTGEWDERRTYDAFFLKENDGEWITPQLVNGKIRIFYAGHLYPDHVGLNGWADVNAALFMTRTL
jgi:hypothetical protein